MKYQRHPITGCRVSSFVSEDVIWMIDPILLEQIVGECKIIMQNPEFWQRDSKVEADKVPEPPYVVEDGVAQIGMSGPFTKYPTSFGTNSTVEKQKAIRDAVKDPNVKSMMLHIESGGGTANGTPELAEEIHAADKIKPVYTFADGSMASAAYYVGAAGRRVFADRNAQIGSIGTAAILYDTSKKFEAAGVKVIPIVSSEFKAGGLGGAPITEVQQADFQRRIDDLNNVFIADVAKFRNLPEQHIRDLKARVYLGSKALEHKLVDEVCTYEQAMKYAKENSNVTAAPRSPAVAPQNPAASRSLAMQTSLSAEQLRVIREKVPGAAQITDDGMVVFLCEQTLRVPTLTQRIADLEKNQAPAGIDPQLLEERAGFVQLSIDALQKEGFATPAQVDGLKKLVQKDSPLAPIMLQRNADGTYGLDRITRIMRDGTAIKLGPQSGKKPEVEKPVVPGEKEAEQADNGEKNMVQASNSVVENIYDKYRKPWKKAEEAAAKN